MRGVCSCGALEQPPGLGGVSRHRFQPPQTLQVRNDIIATTS